MAIQPGVWGIDLGQCGLKAIRLQEIDGEVVATAFDYVEHPKILSQPDADPDQLTREALDKFLSRNNLRGDVVAISVPGQSGLARFVKLPPVEEKKIADIVRFEAKQQIPFNLEEVVWDYQKIGSGTVTDGFAMETEIGLFAMKRDMVNRYLQHFKDVGVDVHVVQMAPLSLCNYVAYDLLGKDVVGGEGEPSSEKKCVVALDIGADSSNLVITDGERIIWQRPIPLGGNHFTRALTKDLKLTFAKAEHLKRNATKSPDLKKILAALKPVLNDFVGEVQRSLGYFTNTHRDAHIEYMIGLGNAFRLPGLQKFLSEKLQLEVRKLNKMERIVGDQVVTQQVYTENVLTFAVAYGLALQGLKRARLLTNLLPQEIRVERLIKAKKPFAVAAAAALLLACGGLALSYALEYRTWGHESVVKAKQAAKTQTDAAAKAKSAFDKAVQDANNEKRAVQSIVAGQFERDNWPELLKFVSATIPQPDGKDHVLPIPNDDVGTPTLSVSIPNIPKLTGKDAPRDYWNTPRPNGLSGKQAFRKYMERLVNAGKEEGGPDELGEGIEDLIQFNIESINGYYCDSLPGYWDAVKNSKNLKISGVEIVRPRDHFSKAPEGSGWVVEVQGWTYHSDNYLFVKNTLLENIARLGLPEAEKKVDAAAPGGNPPPAAGKPPAPAAAAGASGGASEEKEDLGPVVNRISHVVLYQWHKSAPKGPFELLGKSQDIRSLTAAKPAGAGDTAAAGNPMMMGAGQPGGGSGGGGGGDSTTPAAISRDGWVPLSGSEGGGAPRTGGAGGPGGKGGGAGAGAGAGGGGLKPPAGAGAGGAGAMGGGKGAADNQPVEPGSGPQRTEFVILFIWKEPIPSDSLRSLAGEKPTGASTQDKKADQPKSRNSRGHKKTQVGG